MLWRRSMGYLEAILEAPHPNPLPEGEGWGLVYSNTDCLPPQERGTPVKTGPKCREQTQVTPLDAAFLEGLVQENGHRGSGGVAVLVDVYGDLRGRDIEAVGNGVEDAHIRLVEQEVIDFIDTDLIGF